MILTRIKIGRFRQFIDQTLEVDPLLTAIVGRNDSGKTGLLRRFFDQYINENSIHAGDCPRIPGETHEHIEFTLTWRLDAQDFTSDLIRSNFDSSVKELSATFHYAVKVGQGGVVPWVYSAGAGDFCVLPRVRRQVFPNCLYISVGDKEVLNYAFQVCPYEIGQNTTEPLFHPELVPTETLFMRLAGLRTLTRSADNMNGEWLEMKQLQPSGSQTPFSKRMRLSHAEFRSYLDRISEAITSELARWWPEPLSIAFEASIAGAQAADVRQETFMVTWQIVESRGVQLHGTGMYWFVALILRVLYVRSLGRRCLVLFDEPGNPLHPEAQRGLSRLFSDLAESHQLLYSTHAPFLLDWRFPQRVRLFLRDPVTMRSAIENKPYKTASGMYWSSLREAIGISIGEASGIASQNVFVEGVSDQIILCNAFACLARRGRNVPEAAVLPHGSSARSLEYLQSIVTSRRARSLVIGDYDQEGKQMRQACKRRGVAFLGLEEIGPAHEVLSASGENPATDSIERSQPMAEAAAEQRHRSIEDLIPLDTFVEVVNSFYGRFEWYVPFSSDEVRDNRGKRSTGTFFEDAFMERFDESFNKVGVAVEFAESLNAVFPPDLSSFERLAARIIEMLLP